MKQSQLFELINTLNSQEKEQILAFARQDSLPGRKMKMYIEPLLKLCLSHPWQEHAKELTRSEAYKTVFPGQNFVEGKLEKVMVEAQKVIRDYLLTQHYFREKNQFYQDFDFAEIVRLRGLDSRYKQYLSKLKKSHEASQIEDAYYFHKKYLLEYAIHNQESLYNQAKGDLNIPSTVDALELHYQLNKLALLNVYLLQQKVANISVSETMMERLYEPNVHYRYFLLSPSLKINYTIFQLLKKESPEKEDVQSLFDLLLEHENKLDISTLNGFYTYLRNICILIIFRDPERIDINNILFELYKDNLSRGILHYEGKLHPSRYLSISECAVATGNLDWAIEFVEQHKHEIIGDNETQDVYRLNLAYLLFSKGKYEECLDHLPETSPFVDHLLTGKRLELKALYELQSDLLPYKTDAFKMFLSRTSQKLLPDSRRKKNLDFLNMLNQISASIPGDQKRAARLIARIKEEKHAAEHHWLLKKAEQLSTT